MGRQLVKRIARWIGVFGVCLGMLMGTYLYGPPPAEIYNSPHGKTIYVVECADGWEGDVCAAGPTPPFAIHYHYNPDWEMLYISSHDDPIGGYFFMSPFARSRCARGRHSQHRGAYPAKQ